MIADTKCLCGLPATRVYRMITVKPPLGLIPICEDHEFEKFAGTIEKKKEMVR